MQTQGKAIIQSQYLWAQEKKTNIKIAFPFVIDKLNVENEAQELYEYVLPPQ